MDIAELRKKPAVELEKLLKSSREQMRDLRFKVNAKEHKDVRDLREIKHTIARIQTILKEQKILKAITAQAKTPQGK